MVIEYFKLQDIQLIINSLKPFKLNINKPKKRVFCNNSTCNDTTSKKQNTPATIE